MSSVFGNESTTFLPGRRAVSLALVMAAMSAGSCAPAPTADVESAELGGDPSVAGYCTTSDGSRVNLGGLGTWYADDLGTGPTHRVAGGTVRCGDTDGPWITVRRGAGGTEIGVGEGLDRTRDACLRVTFDDSLAPVVDSIAIESRCTSSRMIETLRAAGADLETRGGAGIPAELARQRESLELFLDALSGRDHPVGAGDASCLPAFTNLAAACDDSGPRIATSIVARNAQAALEVGSAVSAACAATTLTTLVCQAANPAGRASSPPTCQAWATSAQCCAAARCECAVNPSGLRSVATTEGECPASVRTGGSRADGPCGRDEIRARNDVARLAPGTHDLAVAGNDCLGGAPARLAQPGAAVRGVTRVDGGSGNDFLRVTCEEGQLLSLVYGLLDGDGNQVSTGTATVYCSGCDACTSGGGAWCTAANPMAPVCDPAGVCPPEDGVEGIDYELEDGRYVDLLGVDVSEPGAVCQYPCESSDQAGCSAAPGCAWCASLGVCTRADRGCNPGGDRWLSQ